MATGHHNKLSDKTDMESRGILYEGANISQLCMLFNMDHRTIVAKLHGVPPDGVRNRADIWKIATAAPHLVKPIYDIESYMRNMAHTELPKMLTKEFWAGQRSRQEYELKAGDLWSTARVVEKVGELMKIFKMSARLFIDAVDQQSQLVPKQRDIIRQLTDGMLEECSHQVVKHFSYEKKADATVYVKPEELVEDDDEL